MKESEFHDLMAALTETQEVAMDKQEAHSSDQPKHMYYVGKDIGLAEAKNLLREHVEFDNE